MVGTASEVLDEDPTEPDGPEECANLRKVAARAPVAYHGQLVVVGQSAFVRTPITKYEVLGRQEDGFLAGVRSTGVAHALADAVEYVEVFAHEPSYFRVFGNSFEVAVGGLVAG